jgi:hypothetical protein
MWNNYPKKLTGAEGWGETKFTYQRVGATVDARRDRDGKLANIINKKEEMLRRVSYLPNEHNQYCELYLPGQAHQ